MPKARRVSLLLSLVLGLCLAPSHALKAQSAKSTPLILSPSTAKALPATAPSWLGGSKVSTVLRFLPPAQPAFRCLCEINCWWEADNLWCCQDQCCNVTCTPQ